MTETVSVTAAKDTWELAADGEANVLITANGTKYFGFRVDSSEPAASDPFHTSFFDRENHQMEAVSFTGLGASDQVYVKGITSAVTVIVTRGTPA